jgi:hypothetical protein
MSEPHSLYAAAQKLATATGISWSELQVTYRALQEAPRGKMIWLPKSVGRNVYYAHPWYIWRLLGAHFSCTDAESARDTIEWMKELTRDGKKYDLDEKPAANIPLPIEKEFEKYLTDVEQAKKLKDVEIQTDTHRIIFNFNTKDQNTIWSPALDVEDLPPAPLVVKRPVISGDVFRDLAKNIRWRSDAYGAPTLKKVQQGSVD